MHDVIGFDSYEIAYFYCKYYNGDFAGQRIGQAFVSHFNLDRLSDKRLSDELYQLDGDIAKAFIRSNFLLF